MMHSTDLITSAIIPNRNYLILSIACHIIILLDWSQSAVRAATFHTDQNTFLSCVIQQCTEIIIKTYNNWVLYNFSDRGKERRQTETVPSQHNLSLSILDWKIDKRTCLLSKHVLSSLVQLDLAYFEGCSVLYVYVFLSEGSSSTLQSVQGCAETNASPGGLLALGH